MGNGDRTEPGGSEAFGEEFRTLMHRIAAEYEALAGKQGDAERHARLRREVADAFELETERLLSKHLVEIPVAQYVRHVVRKGFDSAYDPMDPASESSTAAASSHGEAGWCRTAPDAPGAYALMRLGSPGQVELARFDRQDDAWAVQRWGLAGASTWGELVRDGWQRWSEDTRNPGS